MAENKIAKNSKDIVVKAVGDAVSIGVGAMVIAGLLSVGTSLFRLVNGRPIRPGDDDGT